MIKPSLSDVSIFDVKPKPVIVKSKYEIHKSHAFYMNIVVLLIIVVGCGALYYRKKYKSEREHMAKSKVKHLEDYINEYDITTMLNEQHNNQNNNISY